MTDSSARSRHSVTVAISRYHEQSLSSTFAMSRVATVKQTLEEMEAVMAAKFKLNERNWMKEAEADVVLLDTKGNEVRTADDHNQSLTEIFEDKVKHGWLLIRVNPQQTHNSPLKEALSTRPTTSPYTRPTPTKLQTPHIDITTIYLEDLFLGEVTPPPSGYLTPEYWETEQKKLLAEEHCKAINGAFPFALKPELGLSTVSISPGTVTRLPGRRPHCRFEFGVRPVKEAGKKAVTPIRSGRVEWALEVQGEESRRRKQLKELGIFDGKEGKISHNGHETEHAPVVSNDTASISCPTIQQDDNGNVYEEKDSKNDEDMATGEENNNESDEDTATDIANGKILDHPKLQEPERRSSSETHKKASIYSPPCYPPPLGIPPFIPTHTALVSRLSEELRDLDDPRVSRALNSATEVAEKLDFLAHEQGFHFRNMIFERDLQFMGITKGYMAELVARFERDSTESKDASHRVWFYLVGTPAT
ncbi:hypothetical protein BJ508DRAFT_313850 [Ascobolus immersus RN42]|uniref:Uncharacterized protein n=1 Tax=Ascobolus immersus RN42 TaxID=1160509 RepID=A0A3N4HNE7_ASCIM|nr:hypothetical protein BJ508DRAFT_313850 [Ascobolus immersus RN42]